MQNKICRPLPTEEGFFMFQVVKYLFRYGNERKISTQPAIVKNRRNLTLFLISSFNKFRVLKTYLMKTQLSLAAIVLLFLNVSWVSPADNRQIFSNLSPAETGQVVKNKTVPNPNFSFFRTHRQARGIMANWGLTTNAGVSGFVVERTYEDPNDPYADWTTICSMPCGPGRSFKHHDLNVSPGFISYRVIAYLQGGGSLMSLISTEHIVQH